MKAQVPSPAARLTDLPTEVLGIICRPLSLADRICLSVTCCTLLRGLASSEDAWGTLKVYRVRTIANMLHLLHWLAQRRHGLRSLDLSFLLVSRDVRGQAAPQLAACLEGSPLVQLRLTGFKLCGEEGSAVLKRLGSCTALTSLALTECELGCLPGALGLLPALAELSLQSHDLDEASFGQLRHLTALTRLDISWSGLAALPAELDALPRLAELELQGNEGLGEAAEEAWAPLAQCSALTSLALGEMPLARLPPALAALAPHLSALSLIGLTERGLWEGGEATLGPLHRLTRLTRLDLSGSLVHVSLSESLSRLVALQDLDLSWNAFLGGELGVCPLCYLTGLTRLSLHKCNLNDVPEEVTHLQALRDLDFANYQCHAMDITDAGWQHLIKLTGLTRLYLGGSSIKCLPQELSQLRCPADLDLRENMDLGSHWGTTTAAVAAKWAALEQLTALTRLDASSCKLDAVLAALPGLRALGLAGNSGLGRGG